MALDWQHLTITTVAPLKFNAKKTYFYKKYIIRYLRTDWLGNAIKYEYRTEKWKMSNEQKLIKSRS